MSEIESSDNHTTDGPLVITRVMDVGKHIPSGDIAYYGELTFHGTGPRFGPIQIFDNGLPLMPESSLTFGEFTIKLAETALPGKHVYTVRGKYEESAPYTIVVYDPQ